MIAMAMVIMPIITMVTMIIGGGDMPTSAWPMMSSMMTGTTPLMTL